MRHRESPAARVAERQRRDRRLWRMLQSVAAAASVHDGWRHPMRRWRRPGEGALCERTGLTPLPLLRIA